MYLTDDGEPVLVLEDLISAITQRRSESYQSQDGLQSSTVDELWLVPSCHEGRAVALVFVAEQMYLEARCLECNRVVLRFALATSDAVEQWLAKGHGGGSC